MSAHDDYDARTQRRNKDYRIEYARWFASLPPDKKEELRRKGLHEPLQDGSSESAPAERDPEREMAYANHIASLRTYDFELPLEEGDEGYAPEDAADHEMSPVHRRALYDFLCAWGNPERTWAVLRYLLGFGTCEEHARALGLTKQAFSYHVRTTQKALHLPPLGNQKSLSARKKYVLANRRKLRCVFGLDS